MQQDFYKKLEAALSAERLSAYGRDNPGPCTAMARYLWNIAICESLYSPLQMFEVALRNSIHGAMTTLCGADNLVRYRITHALGLSAGGQRQAENSHGKQARNARPRRG